MEIKRAVLTALAAAALILASACGTTHTTTTTTTTVPNSTSGTYDTSSTTSTTTTSNNLVTSTPAPVITSTDNGQATTTTLPNGSKVTRLETTTVVYPDGTTKTYNTTTDVATGAITTDLPTTLPPGAKVVTKTTTTVTVPPNQTVVTVPQPQTGMSSSSTTVYPAPVAVPFGYNQTRRIPGLDFLVFANRASFSSSNSFPGTLNTGDIRTDIRNQTGYGLGLNAWFNRHFSAELTASRIHPQTNFTATNAGVNPITGLRLKMTPITGTLQLHFNPYSAVDAYLGAGAAYVLFKTDQNFNAGTTGITAINFRDEWGPLADGGLGFNISRHFGINLDAKYMWVRARANTTFNTATIGNVGNNERIGLNPFIISAGLRFGF